MTRRRLAVVLAAAALLAAALVAASWATGRGGAADAGTAGAPRPYAGVPQAGAVLGDPAAPVTLVEYADLQCPYCAEWARRTLPTLVTRYVRAGQLRIVFRGLAFLGPDSQEALDAVVAAGRHGRLWDVVDGLYRRQGAENSGWVTDDVVAEVAAEAGLDPAALRSAADDPEVRRRQAADARAATRARVRGTPAFELGPTGGELVLVQLDSLDPGGLVPLVDALLAE